MCMYVLINTNNIFPNLTPTYPRYDAYKHYKNTSYPLQQRNI